MLELLWSVGFQVALKPYARLDSPEITEMSGIAKSRQYADVYWVHNDSGDRARIFPIRRNGHLVSGPKGIAVDGARNVDWEDIAIDGKTLYISDLGNNSNKRRDLTIYVVPEPNPFRATHIAMTDRIRVAYPDQTTFPPDRLDFDCESIFVLRGKIFVITKDRLAKFLPATSATLYRLDTRDPNRVNVLTKVDRSERLAGWVTAADASPDGQTVAFLTHFPGMAVYTVPGRVPGDRFLSSSKLVRTSFSGLGQCEALCFDGPRSFIVGNEEGELFEVPVVK